MKAFTTLSTYSRTPLGSARAPPEKRSERRRTSCSLVSSDASEDKIRSSSPSSNKASKSAPVGCCSFLTVAGGGSLLVEAADDMSRCGDEVTVRSQPISRPSVALRLVLLPLPRLLLSLIVTVLLTYIPPPPSPMASSPTPSRLRARAPSTSNKLWSLLPRPSSIVDLTIPIPGSSVPSSSSSRPLSPNASRRPGLAAARAARANSPRRAGEPPAVGESRWRSREFCFYYAVFILVLPRMVGSVVRLSRGE